MSRRRKAALIVQLLISDGGKLPLSSLPGRTQEMLARELGAIRLVDRDTVNAVAAEFASILGAVGLSAPGGADAALAALSDQLSPELAERLRIQMDQPGGRDPWHVLAECTPERIAHILSCETVQTAAILISKLPVALAAQALAETDGAHARRITHAMSRTGDTPPLTIGEIGAALVADYCMPKASSFAKPAPARVGSLLNAAPAAMRDDLLAGLDDADSAFASDVRKTIFTFADLPRRLKPVDVPIALRAVPPEVLTRALAYAESQSKMVPTAAFIFENLSQRMGGQLRDDMNENGIPEPDLGEAALNEVMGAIRELADGGDLSLLPPTDS